MTFEERIDALTARHEALTARHEALSMNLELATHEIEAQRERTDRILTALEKLLAIVESHERRLTNIEGGNA